jgi:hypothetical protein
MPSAGPRCRRADGPARLPQRPYRRQLGGRLSRPAAGDEPGRAGTQLMLFGSTPGHRHSQAPSGIPQIQAKGEGRDPAGVGVDRHRQGAAVHHRSSPRRRLSHSSATSPIVFAIPSLIHYMKARSNLNSAPHCDRRKRRTFCRFR